MSEEIRIISGEKPKIYNRLATHPLQSWEWGEFRKAQKHKVIRFGEFENKKLVKAGQITFHYLPKSSFTVGYFPKGPMPDKEMVSFLKKIGQENKAIFIKMEPNEEIQSGRAPYRTVQGRVSKMQSLGLVPGKSLFTKYTSVIDLNKTEEDLLKSFKQKTRYNIRLAEKHGIKVQEDNSEKAFSEYLKLLFETTGRQGFYAHDKKFHSTQWEILKPAGISHLLTATYKEKILAAFLVFVFNGVLYYPYGASTREHKELMAPTLLMWEAIKLGKKMGCKKFDLWGDVEPNPPPDHPYFGFHRFKEGFSPKLVEFVGTYDLVINPTLYYVYKTIDAIRWKILRIKGKILSTKS